VRKLPAPQALRKTSCNKIRDASFEQERSCQTFYEPNFLLHHAGIRFDHMGMSKSDEVCIRSACKNYNMELPNAVKVLCQK
jgi:hypothetical protein